MLNTKVLGAVVNSAGDGPTIVMDISPFYPRHKVMAHMDVTDDFAGEMEIESSDTGVFGGEETVELATGVLSATADKTTYEGEITLKKYMRYVMVGRSAGSANANLQSGS